MKNKQKWFLVPLFATLVIIVGAVSYYFLNKSENPNIFPNNTHTVDVLVQEATTTITTTATTTKETKILNKVESERDWYNKEAKRIRDWESKALGPDGTYITECAPAKSFQEVKEINLEGKSGLIISSEEGFYEIRGSNQGEVGYQLINCIPDLSINFKLDKLKNATAITMHTINYRYEYRDKIDNKICGISNVSVGLNLLVIYPKWTGKWDGTTPPDTNINLNDRWEELRSYLIFHENTHVNNSKQYASEFLAYLDNLSNSTECIDEKSIEQKYEDLTARLNAVDDKFDEGELKKDTGWHLNY